mgnify:CR=1 FL=1|tara:strand:+ start:17 stop:196 length:180 start_codon:yes stop_codon:yes gene_type:complete
MIDGMMMDDDGDGERAREECDDGASDGVSDTMMRGNGAMMMDGDGDGGKSARGVRRQSL